MEIMTVLLGFMMGAVVGGAFGFIMVYSWAKSKLLAAHTEALQAAGQLAKEKVMPYAIDKLKRGLLQVK